MTVHDASMRTPTFRDRGERLFRSPGL